MYICTSSLWVWSENDICFCFPPIAFEDVYSLWAFNGVEEIRVGSNLEKRRRACGLATALEVASKPESKRPKFCQSAGSATSIGVFKMLLASVLSSCTPMESVATETLLFEEPTLGGRDTGRQESVAVDVNEPPYKKR